MTRMWQDPGQYRKFLTTLQFSSSGALQLLSPWLRLADI